MDYFKTHTKFGTVWLLPTELGHIYVRLYEKDATDSNVVVNGVPISGDAHFYVWKDGMFGLGLESYSPYERRQQLYLFKLNARNYNDIPSESVREKMTDELTVVVNRWAISVTQALIEAEVEHLEDNLSKTDQSIAENEEVLRRLNGKREQLALLLQERKKQLARFEKSA